MLPWKIFHLIESKSRCRAIFPFAQLTTPHVVMLEKISRTFTTQTADYFVIFRCEIPDDEINTEPSSHSFIKAGCGCGWRRILRNKSVNFSRSFRT